MLEHFRQFIGFLKNTTITLINLITLISNSDLDLCEIPEHFRQLIVFLKNTTTTLIINSDLSPLCFLISSTTFNCFESPLYLLFIMSFISTIFLFFISVSSFFRLVLSVVFVLLCAMLLAYSGLDFFSGLLLTAELPMLLVGFLFFFQKNSLVFDNVYSLKSSNIRAPLFFFVFSIILFYKSNFYNQNINWYEFPLISALTTQFNNDFFAYYNLYYCIYPIYVVLIALTIFTVSYLVIVIFYFSKLSERTSAKKTQNILFIRKQNIMRQSIYKSTLGFFKKK